MTQYSGFKKQFVLHVSPTQEEILSLLIERHGTDEEGLAQVEMWELVDKAKSTVSEAVEWLESNDLVKREERDGQQVVVLKNPELFPVNSD
jgi:predicted transcriptional regulator